MFFLDKWLTKLGNISQGKIDLYSLQFRLILGMVSILLLGMSSLALWTGWEMEQFLIVTHQQKIEAIANRFLQDLERYSAIFPMETGLQQAIDRGSSPDLSVWVKCADGKMMTESKTITIPPTNTQTVSMSIQPIPSKSQVYNINGKQMTKYSGVLQVDSKTMGQLYIEQDMTNDYRRFRTVLHSLKIAILLSIVVITIIFSLLIWRLLLPLRQMSQWMRTHTTQLNPYQLNLNRTPSEVKQLAKAWNRLSIHLSLHRQQQRQFTNNIAHELRTPLSLVYGYLQSTLRRSDNLTILQQEALSIAVSETERTIQILQDLINLARAENGSILFQEEVLVLNDLISEMARMTEKFKQRAIKIESEPLPVQVKGDRDLIRQVLTHLIDNAVKYSDADQPITLKLNQSDSWAVIQVCDHGCGIPESEQPRIFEALQRVDPSRTRSTGGVGLGLSFVKSLVEGMGGQVTVQSRQGIGSTFTVTLPLTNE